MLSKAAAAYVTLVRNTPLLMVFFFFQFAAPKIGINFNWIDVHIGDFDFTSFFATAVVALSSTPPPSSARRSAPASTPSRSARPKQPAPSAFPSAG